MPLRLFYMYWLIGTMHRPPTKFWNATRHRAVRLPQLSFRYSAESYSADTARSRATFLEVRLSMPNAVPSLFGPRIRLMTLTCSRTADFEVKMRLN